MTVAGSMADFDASAFETQLRAYLQCRAPACAIALQLQGALPPQHPPVGHLGLRELLEDLLWLELPNARELHRTAVGRRGHHRRARHERDDDAQQDGGAAAGP